MQFYNCALILILYLFPGDFNLNHLTLTDFDLICKSVLLTDDIQF